MPRLLVVEDYPPLATVIAIGLRRSGYEVERVGSIERALGTQGRFDLAVFDLDLPDGSGLELAARLLAQDRVERVVFFTASRETSARAEASRYGPVVDKSAGIPTLTAVVNEQFGVTVKVSGSEMLVGLERASGRSGTRRKVE